MWGLFGLALLIPILLGTGWLEAVKWILLAVFVLLLLAFLVVGTIWERRSGASNLWKGPWRLRQNAPVYITALIAAGIATAIYVSSRRH
jgi:hypothetical protein